MLINRIKKTKNKWKKGFTLVELLVAMVIMSILTISVFAITSSASRTFAKGTETLMADDVKDLVLALVKKNLYTKEEIFLDSGSALGQSGEIKTEYLKTHHAMFSFNGYVYYLESNYLGEFELDDNGLPVGSKLILEESAYDKYGVQISFVPLYNATSGNYLTLRVQVYVFERDNPERVVTQGKESFKLLNLERLGNSIDFTSSGSKFICYFA